MTPGPDTSGPQTSGPVTSGPETPGSVTSGTAPDEAVTFGTAPDEVDDSAGGAGGPGGAPGGPSVAPTAPAPDVVIDTALPVALTRTLVAIGSEPQYPVAVIVVVLGFLLVQHGIDGRDPKLAAAAATQRDNELLFEDPFPSGGSRPGPGAR